MPTALVRRYAVYVHLPGETLVKRTISRDPSFLIAVETCLAASRETGHFDYVIEDERKPRSFLLDRTMLLQILFLKTHDRTAYFEILNRLDRGGTQDELTAFLRERAKL